MVWDLRSPSTPPVRVPTGTDLQGLALSPDGRTLYTSWPLTAYDVASGERSGGARRSRRSTGSRRERRGNPARARRTGAGKNALLVSAATGETVHTLRGHRDRVCDIRFSPDGTLVGSVSDDGELIVWDTATGRPLERWDTFDPWGVGFSPDNDLVYGGGGDSMLRTWDLSVEDTYLQQTTQVGDAEVFAHADLSPDGQQVAYRWLDGARDGSGSSTPSPAKRRRPPALPVSEGPWSGHLASRRRQYVAYVLRHRRVRGGPAAVVLDSATGKLLEKRELVRRRRLVAGVRRRGAAACSWATSRTARTHHRRRRDPATPGRALRHRRARYATPIGDGSTAMVHELRRRRHLRALAGDRRQHRRGPVRGGRGPVRLRIRCLSGRLDGRGGGDTGEIVTIDVSTGDEQRRSTGLGAEVLWLNYSDDGELLVSGADDGGVSLWDATTLDLLGTVYPPHHGEPVPAGAQFIGDTHDVAIASYDGTVYRWETDLDRAIDFACQMAGRNLTEEEWEEFLPAQPYQSVCPDE